MSFARTFPTSWNPATRRLEYRDETGERKRVPLTGGGGGGGVTSHPALTSLAWGSSGHTGTASRIAGFDGSGAATVYTASAMLDLISSTQGVVLYRGASGWAALSPGTSGHFLKTNGAGADPSWAAASGGGGSTDDAVWARMMGVF